VSTDARTRSGSLTLKTHMHIHPLPTFGTNDGSSRYNHSYSPFFTSFDAFLSFGWGCVVVTDSRTGKGHVAVRAEGSNASAGVGGGGGSGSAVAGTGKEGGTVQQFARMVKVRCVSRTLVQTFAVGVRWIISYTIVVGFPGLENRYQSCLTR